MTDSNAHYKEHKVYIKNSERFSDVDVERYILNFRQSATEAENQFSL
jgi:hypothetical protein